MGDNSEPAPSKKKRYCVKFKDSWCNKFKFIQKSWTREGFALCTVCGSDFSVTHEGENDINGHKTRTPQNIDLWMLHNDKENNWFWVKLSDCKL